MQVKATHLDTRALELELSTPGVPPEQRRLVRLSSATGITGELEQLDNKLRLSGVQAKEATLDELRLQFGSVVLEAGGNTQLSRLSAEYSAAGADTKLRLGVGALSTPRLQIEVGTVVVAANVRLESAELVVDGSEGQLKAPHASFSGLLVTIGNIKLGLPELSAEAIVISWGKEGFTLSASNVIASGADFKTTGTELRGEGVRASRLLVHDADWSLQGFSLDAARVEVNLVSAPTEVGAEPVDPNPEPPPSVADAEQAPAEYRAEKPVFDWRLLDYVSGRLDVDVGVEIRLPVIHRRRAVHEFRVAVDQGTVNFRDLEKNLSTLEDALLDFSVRDDELVLELGVPLLPTRGRGKPLVRWPLRERERALAEEHRVRLVTLAHPLSTNGEADPSEKNDDADSSERLRELAFHNIDVLLSVAPPSSRLEALLWSLAIGKLSLNGSLVAKDPGGAVDTTLQGSLEDVLIELDDFPLTGRRFDLKTVRVAQVASVQLGFTNLAPTRLNLELKELSSKSVDFGRFAKD